MSMLRKALFPGGSNARRIGLSSGWSKFCKRDTVYEPNRRGYAINVVNAPDDDVQVNMNFALHVSKTLLKAGSLNENRVFSPFSITTMLNMVAAQSEGRTLKQLLSLLEYGSKEEVIGAAFELHILAGSGRSADDPNFIVFANGVWYDMGVVSPPYRMIYNLFDHAEIVPLLLKQKHQAIQTINEQTLASTEGLISQMVSESDIDKTTKMVLSGGFYFRGNWGDMFDVSLTRNHEFHLFNGGTVLVPFMEQSDKVYEYGTLEGYEILKMPYEGKSLKEKRFSMYIFLPDDHKDGLQRLMESIKLEKHMFEEQIKLEPVNINKLVIPRFTAESTAELSATVKQLGLTLPFESCGDLTGIAEPLLGKKLCVSKIIHKTRIENMETGTTAAAATVKTGNSGRSSGLGSADFIADRPFLFLVREEISGATLYVGIVTNPQK